MTFVGEKYTISFSASSLQNNTRPYNATNFSCGSNVSAANALNWCNSTMRITQLIIPVNSIVNVKFWY